MEVKLFVRFSEPVESALGTLRFHLNNSIGILLLDVISSPRRTNIVAEVLLVVRHIVFSVSTHVVQITWVADVLHLALLGKRSNSPHKADGRASRNSVSVEDGEECTNAGNEN